MDIFDFTYLRDSFDFREKHQCEMSKIHWLPHTQAQLGMEPLTSRYVRPLAGTGCSCLPAVVTGGVHTSSPCSQVFGVSFHLEVGLLGHTATASFRGTTRLSATAAAPALPRAERSSLHLLKDLVFRTAVLRA